jgi:hypothetical protein
MVVREMSAIEFSSFHGYPKSEINLALRPKLLFDGSRRGESSMRIFSSVRRLDVCE